MSNSIQYVNIDNIKSETKLISCGVSQGTILGPILFILYCSYVSLSDDTVVFYCGDNWAENNFAKIKQWFNDNILTINAEKNRSMPLQHHHRKSDK